jgi:hypothetical protein
MPTRTDTTRSFGDNSQMFGSPSSASFNGSLPGSPRLETSALFSNRSAMSASTASVGGEQFVCELCGRSYIVTQDLEYHKKMRHQ